MVVLVPALMVPAWLKRKDVSFFFAYVALLRRTHVNDEERDATAEGLAPWMVRGPK